MNDESHTKWTAWDYKLIKAHYILEDWYRDGIPIWWDESERVAFDVSARVSRSRAAVERAQEKAAKSKSQQYGRYFIVEPRVIGGGELPNKEEWMQEQAKKSGVKDVKQRADEGPSVVQGRK